MSMGFHLNLEIQLLIAKAVNFGDSELINKH